MNAVHALRAFPRLHFGLVDLSGATRRAYGGLGAAIDGPCAMVQAHRARGFQLDVNGADDQVRAKTIVALDRARGSGLALSGRFTLVQRLPSHMGLGSTTATILAILQSIAIVNRWPVTAAQLIDLSGRGRTSAVGCNTFFDGGLVADAGQPGHPTSTYLPSLQPKGRGPSLRLGRWRMSPQWVVSLIMCTNVPSVPPADEADFFAAAAPTDPLETPDQLACVYHGLIPAAIEEDLDCFASSLRHFQSRGFKAREIGAQPDVVQATLRRLWADDFAAGLSSLGPALFVISEQATVDLGPYTPLGAETLGPFPFRNSGFDLTAIDDLTPGQAST
jgi:beta-ribofuranosylaminobenzene 5'-phosphate synthase